MQPTPSYIAISDGLPSSRPGQKGDIGDSELAAIKKSLESDG